MSCRELSISVPKIENKNKKEHVKAEVQGPGLGPIARGSVSDRAHAQRALVRETGLEPGDLLKHDVFDHVPAGSQEEFVHVCLFVRYFSFFFSLSRPGFLS